MSESRTQLSRPPAVSGTTRIELTPGLLSAPVYVPASCVVWVKPDPAGSVLVEATWSPQTDIKAGTAAWFPWDQGVAGVVSAAATQILFHATAVRFTASAANAVCGVTV